MNLDIRHTFGSVDLSVTVDGRKALDTTLEGGGKRFKVFGKRAERGYTRTLDLEPGAHVIGVRLVSTPDKFDQTRVERFELGSASVAALRISADKSGLRMVAERSASARAVSGELRRDLAGAASGREGGPPIPATPDATPPSASARADSGELRRDLAGAASGREGGPAPPAEPQKAGTMLELLQSLRSMLIAIAGFVASAATGFVVQEYLRTRRALLFAAGEAGDHQNKRRRAGFAG